MNKRKQRMKLRQFYPATERNKTPYHSEQEAVIKQSYHYTKNAPRTDLAKVGLERIPFLRLTPDFGNFYGLYKDDIGYCRKV